MKNLLLLLCLQLSIGLYAKETDIYPLKVEHATVYLKGAEVTNSAKVNLAKGVNRIKFINIPGGILKNSLVVKASNGVVVQSSAVSFAFYSRNIAAELPSSEKKQLTDSIESLKIRRKALLDSITVIDEQIFILQSNRKASGDNATLSVTELQKLLEFSEKRHANYLLARRSTERKIAMIDMNLSRLDIMMREMDVKYPESEGILDVSLYAKEVTGCALEVTYYTYAAGWLPVYDIATKGVNEPLVLGFKANIFQKTTVPWDNIKLTVSTGNPVERLVAPEMSTWKLRTRNRNELQIKVAHYKPDGLPQLVDTFVQYDDDGNETKNVYQKEEEYVTLDNKSVSVEYNIEIPYSIPTNGLRYLVPLKEFTRKAAYGLIARPKQDKDAFLQASITNWEDMNLLEGETNVYFNGAFVGNGYVNPAVTADTLFVQLGRDKKIILKRELDKESRRVKRLGTTVQEDFGFTIIVKNTYSEAVTIEVEDQVPISTDRNTEVIDIQTGGAEHDENTGLLKWRLTLKADETKKLSFGYSIKYPKDKVVENKW